MLDGGAGNDVFVFGRGGGQDTISEAGDESFGNGNTLQLPGLTPADIRLTPSGVDLVVSLADSSDSITIKNFYLNGDPHNAANPVQRFIFADDTIWELETIVSTASPNHAPTGNVVITGTAGQNALLHATNSLSDIDGLGPIAYQWQTLNDGNNWAAVSGATSNSFTLGEAQVGRQVRVLASYTDGKGTSESVASAATATIANANDVPAGTITVNGFAFQNQTLVATNTLADIDGLGMIDYQWLSSIDGLAWASIAGATSSIFTLGEAQVGLQVRVNASYVDGHGTAESVASAATAPVTNVNDAPSGSVTISGIASQNQMLTAGNTLADVDGLGAIAYQWQTSLDGESWTSIAAATSSSFTLGATLVGEHVRVLASYVDGHGTAEVVASSATAAVIGDDASDNHVPLVAQQIPAQAGLEDTPFAFAVPAGIFVDIDAGDALTLSATLADGSPLPAWLSFDADTQTFSGVPANADVGTLSLALTASDRAGASVTTGFDLSVVNTNDAPVLVERLQNQQIPAGAPYSFTIAANAFVDADLGDVLSYSAGQSNGSALPSWLHFDAATRTLSGTPPVAFSGVVKVTATDLGGASASGVFKLFATASAPMVGGSVSEMSSADVASEGSDNALSNSTPLYGTTADDLTGNAGGEIDFEDWYTATPSKPVVNLQTIAEAMADFSAGGDDPLLDQSVENFNFSGHVGAFDAARTAKPALASGALSNALANFHLAGSDGAVIGGDLACHYGRNGTLAGMGLSAGQGVLNDPAFASQSQALQALSGLQPGSVRLS